MRILHIAYEFPLPTYHGGRLDIWQHILSFKKLGYKTFHISWIDDEVPQKLEEELADNVDDFLLIKKTKGLLKSILKIVKLLSTPSMVQTRTVGVAEYQTIIKKVREFKPSIIFVDVIYAGNLASRISSDLNIPFIMRSQNIEHKYIVDQYLNAKNIKLKLALWMAKQHLRKYEYDILAKAKVVADISQKDKLFWEKEGLKKVFWLPPIFFRRNEEPHSKSPPNFDIVFFGNLNTPNNVDGITWFVDFIFPIITKSLPKVKLLLMGSNPTDKILKTALLFENIEVISNVKNPEKYLTNAKVLINPVRYGSGVKMKIIEMLFTDKQVITTNDGINGLPKQLFGQVFFVTDSEKEFASHSINIIRAKDYKKLDLRENLRREFSVDKVKELIEYAKKK
jgi:hypothetical protein